MKGREGTWKRSTAGMAGRIESFIGEPMTWTPPMVTSIGKTPARWHDQKSSYEPSPRSSTCEESEAIFAVCTSCEGDVARCVIFWVAVGAGLRWREGVSESAIMEFLGAATIGLLKSYDGLPADYDEGCRHIAKGVRYTLSHRE